MATGLVGQLPLAALLLAVLAADPPVHAQCSKPPSQPVVVGDRVFFGGRDLSGRPLLWTSDGTFQGTRAVARIGGEVVESEPEYDQPPFAFTNLLGGAADRIVFVGKEEELWASDGTTAGTERIGPALSPRDPGVVGSTLFFIAGDQQAQQALWRTDGTAGGTALVLTFPEPARCLVAGVGQVYAMVGDALWASDGTPEGTRRLVGPEALGGPVASAVPLGDSVIVVAGAVEGPSGLWRVDPDGTVTPLRESPGFLTASASGGAGGLLFFIETVPPFRRDLWRTDGTRAGTLRLSGVGNGPAVTVDARVLGDTTFLGIQSFLWRTDGTPAGTARVSPLVPYLRPEFPVRYLALSDDRVVFRARARRTICVPYVGGGPVCYDAQHFWVSDGTLEGGVQLTRFSQAADISDVAFLRTFVFLVRSWDVQHGRKGPAGLWRSDGTRAGTRRLKMVDPSDAQVASTLVGRGLAALGCVKGLDSTTDGILQRVFREGAAIREFLASGGDCDASGQFIVTRNTALWLVSTRNVGDGCRLAVRTAFRQPVADFINDNCGYY